MATSSAPVVEIWDSHNQDLRERIGTLITPDPIAISWRTNDNDRFTFTTLGNGTHVDPNTTYYVKAWDDSAAAELSYFVWSATEDQDQNDRVRIDGSGSSGWSIGNALQHRIYHRESWQTSSQGRMFRMGIDGNEASDEHAVLVDGSRSAGGVQRRLEASEGGTVSYDVWLNSRPAGDVTIGVNTTSDLITVSPAELTFTAENSATPQIVTVAARDDVNGVDDHAVIDHTVTGYSGVDSGPSMKVAIYDNDTHRPVGRAFARQGLRRRHPDHRRGHQPENMGRFPHR